MGTVRAGLMLRGCGPRGRGPGAAVALAALAVGLGCAGEPEPPRPNVILLVIDTLRRDALGLYGYARPTSPALDALAAESLVVEDASANAPWTKPAIATLLTSLEPAEHQAIHEGTQSQLAESLLTLPEVFAAAGYRTGGFSENPNIHIKTNFDQGFDFFRLTGGWIRPKAERSVGWALDWAVEEAGDAPFFLYLHLLDPHTPYDPPPALRARFTEGQRTRNRFVRQGTLTPLLRRMDPDELRAEDVAYLRALYDAEIRRVDDAIGTLRARLAEAGLAERTILLVTSDHGEEFLEHGHLAHGGFLYEELLRIPLLLHVPGTPSRRVADATVQQLDVAPTLLELAGIPVPPAFRGRSFAGLLRGEPLPPRPVRAEVDLRGAFLRSVRDGDWKLIRDEREGGVELYHLGRDPGERDDVADANPEVVARLSAWLDALPGGDAALRAEATGEADAELDGQLRALGYLGGPDDEGVSEAPAGS